MPSSPHHMVTTPQSPSSDKRGPSMKAFKRPPASNAHVPKHIGKAVLLSVIQCMY